VIRVNGDDYWLYGAVDHETNKILQFRLFPTTKHNAMVSRRAAPPIQFNDIEFPVDDASYFVAVLNEDGYRFQMITDGNRSAIERVF